MDEIASCPKCRQPVTQTDYFCPSCGKKIRSRQLSTSFFSLLFLLLKTLLLPPFGLVWGYRYLRQSGTVSKLVGLVVIAITIIETVWLVEVTITTFNTVQKQINQQLQLNGL